MDLTELDDQTFEALVVLLLKRESYTINSLFLGGRSREFGDKRVDIDATDPHGRRVFVEIKQVRTPAALSQALRRVGALAQQFREQFPHAEFLCVVSQPLDLRARNEAGRSNMRVWDGKDINRLLTKNPDIATRITEAASARDLSRLLDDSNVSAASKASSITAELAALPAGRSTWRNFEEVGSRFLTDIFLGHLGAPTIQNRTADGRKIMDAIFDVPHANSSWSPARSEYNTKFIVAEFKNYAKRVGSAPVQQLTQYLYPKAFRMVGLLVSRHEPNDSALAARREAWVDQGKLIVFLSDDNLIEMARLADEGRDPYELVDAQLMDFFRRLIP